jgi:hypothetical protein
MAADSTIRVDIATQFLGKKAFKDADTATAKLIKSVKSLAATFGVAFGARAVFNYSKQAVKAFAADEKAAKSLSLTLDNLGLSFADPTVKKFIAGLETQYGVVDDLLRPAYQKLLTTTGDYLKSQDLLKTALDLAAMSGSDVVSVTDDLARAYAGNTRGLIKYGLGLSKTQLAAMSYEEILAQIAKVSKGQAEAAADSYSGALDRLTVASNNAKESLGKDLITALSTLGGEGGLPKTLKLIESVSSGLGDLAIGVSRLIRNIIILGSGNPLESIKDLKKATAADNLADMKERAQYGGVYADIYKTQAASLTVTKKSVTQSKTLTKETKAQLDAKKKLTAIDKANLALGKGSSVFDIDAIQINAALIAQAEQLGKTTNSAQLLAITNDTARLNVKKSMYELEQAIASGDTAAIEKATARLNEDLKLLDALTNQKSTVQNIADILASLKPKQLIDIENLRLALELLSQLKIPSLNVPGAAPSASPFVQTPNGISATTAPASLQEINNATADLAGVVTVIGDNGIEFTKLLDGIAPVFQAIEDSGAFNALVNSFAGGAINSFDPGSFKAGEGTTLPSLTKVGAFDNNSGMVVNVTVQGSVLSEQDLVQVVQNAVQTNNRYGNNLNVAGSV